jgi:hypothetical protein
MKEGQRVRLTMDVERYPFFIARKGEIGTLVVAHDEGKNDRQFAVKMDNKLESCEEWDNCIIWDGDDCDYFADQVEAMKGANS